MQNKTLGILMIILLLFSACKDEETPLSSTKQLISYSIQKSDNQGKIKNDVRGSIKGNVITLSMDQYDDLKSLIATFKYEGTSVSVNGVGQESGITSNDFSRPLMILVEAEDGSREQYTVEVVLKDARRADGTWVAIGLDGHGRDVNAARNIRDEAMRIIE